MRERISPVREQAKSPVRRMLVIPVRVEQSSVRASAKTQVSTGAQKTLHKNIFH